MTGTLVTESILNLLELKHNAKIYANCHLTDKLLNYSLILGKDIRHKLDIFFNLRNKTITGQEVSILMEPPNCTVKESFVIKESCTLSNARKRIKEILDEKYEIIA